MAASVNDYFQKLGGSSSLVNTPKVTATRSSGSGTLTVDNCNWDTTTGKIFATYRVDTSGEVVDGTQTIWTGVVNSTTSIGSLTRLAGAADTGHAIGDYVELLPASLWANKLVDGLLVEHNQDGTHGAVTADSLTVDGTTTLTGNLDVNDSSTAIRDSSDNELVKFAKTASAVNEITVTNAATGNAPEVAATGGDTNVPLKLSGKGTGAVQMFVNGTNQLGSFIDISGTSTVVGWSSTTIKQIYFQQIGKLGIVFFFINGTSNSTSTSLTVPVNAASTLNSYEGTYGQGTNNGTNVTFPRCLIAGGSSVVEFFTQIGGTGWTASGSKQIRGYMFFEVA